MINIAVETLVLRCEDFSSSLSLLMPTFSFPIAPQCLTTKLRRHWNAPLPLYKVQGIASVVYLMPCLLYTSDAADDLLCVDLGGRRIIKKKKKKKRKKTKKDQ
eukprot:TRINITY_DN2_c0_g1_i30.p1 TRINITY_DN2_c0_g1~~TRINITY_DN2_c0_g1_i30.p1  ORF type:complete len:103 (-),score=7.81 TRINITY_DN2_c0_g1_i30:44-352(-)